MNPHLGNKARRQFLCHVLAKESKGLNRCKTRLFTGETATEEIVNAWVVSDEYSERLDAYTTRFSRLQDSLGDKLLAAVLKMVGEPVSTPIDNLDKAERFGWLGSTDEWLALRALGNRFVHEYINDIAVLTVALNRSLSGVEVLEGFGQCLSNEVSRRLKH